MSLEEEICDICNKIVTDEDDGLFCERCSIWKHRTCLGISKKTYQKVSKSKQPWYCSGSKCTTFTGGQNKDQQPKRVLTLEDVMEKLESMDQKYSSLLIRYNEQVEINQRLQHEIREIKSQLNKREQQELKNNLIIQGIPNKENENVEDIIKKIGHKLEIPVEGKFKAYRIGKDHTKKISAIKVIFDEHNTKARWLKSKKKVHLNTSELGYNTSNKVYLNHDLTKANLELYKAARNFKNENAYKFLWIANGNILLRKDESSKVVLLETTEQLKN